MSLLLAGCATTIERASPNAVEYGGAKLDAAAIAAELLTLEGTRVQSIEGAWRTDTFSAECVMKGDGEKFTCAFLAPMMRLATLTVTRPCAVRFERAAALPDSFEPEWMFFDLALVNLPPDRLRRALGRRFIVRVSPNSNTPTLEHSNTTSVSNTPTLEHSNTTVFSPEGVIAVRTANADGSVRVVNRVYGYEYVVREIQR